MRTGSYTYTYRSSLNITQTHMKHGIISRKSSTHSPTLHQMCSKLDCMQTTNLGHYPRSRNEAEAKLKVNPTNSFNDCHARTGKTRTRIPDNRSRCAVNFIPMRRHLRGIYPRQDSSYHAVQNKIKLCRLNPIMDATLP